MWRRGRRNSTGLRVLIAVSRSGPIHGNLRKDPYIIGPLSRIVVVAASFYWSSLGKSFTEVVLFVPHVCGSSRKGPYIIGPSSWIVIVAASFYWSSLGNRSLKSFCLYHVFVVHCHHLQYGKTFVHGESLGTRLPKHMNGHS